MELCNIAVVRELLARHGFRFSKSLGQNFIIDPAVPHEMVHISGADRNTGVLEIGPGIGPLTQELCRAAGKVVSVELDQALYPVLAETMAEFDHFRLIGGDIMKLDIPALVRQEFPSLRPIVCANLPYNITSPVLTALVRAKCFSSITVLVQKEVADRIVAAPGTADYGAFSLFMQFYTEPKKCFDVPGSSFVPPPKVTSSVLHCITADKPRVQVMDEEHFHRTVRAAFALRRKTLINSLQTGFGNFSKTQLADAVRSVGLSENIRGEQLNLEEFAHLSDALRKMEMEK